MHGVVADIPTLPHPTLEQDLAHSQYLLEQLTLTHTHTRFLMEICNTCAQSEQCCTHCYFFFACSPCVCASFCKLIHSGPLLLHHSHSFKKQLSSLMIMRKMDEGEGLLRDVQQHLNHTAALWNMAKKHIHTHTNNNTNNNTFPAAWPPVLEVRQCCQCVLSLCLSYAPVCTHLPPFTSFPTWYTPSHRSRAGSLSVEWIRAAVF